MLENELKKGLLSKALIISLSLSFPTVIVLAETTDTSSKIVSDEVEEVEEVEDIESEYEEDDSDEFEDDEFGDDEDWDEEEEESKLSISGFIKNETSFYTKDGNSKNDGTEVRTGERKFSHEAGDVMKFENSINLFINYDFTEETTFHGQTNFIYDSEAIDGYDGHRINTQYDYLREFYIDSVFGDWEIRVGKQQVAWGTADGVKFLDIINPTDYREWGQNAMEDSRIPLWMLTAEVPIGESGMSTLQFVIIPDLELNQIAGLHNSSIGDFEQPFVSLGAETMTGKYNGFLNIAKDMGQTSSIFQSLLSMGGLGGLTGAMKYATVSEFTSMSNFSNVANMPNVNTALVNSVFVPLANMYDDGNGLLDAAANGGKNLYGKFQTYMMTKLIPTALDTIEGFDKTAESFDMTKMDMTNDSVQALFALMPMMGINLDMTDPETGQMLANMTMAQLQGMLEPAMAQLDPIFQDGSTNQFDGTLSVDNPTSAFDYMGNTAFGTFKYFKGMNTVYRKDYKTENAENTNLGFRWKSTIGVSTNYSFNYYYHWDNNPYVDLSWEDSHGRNLEANFVESNIPDQTGATHKVTALENMRYQDGTNFENANENANEKGQITNPATLVFTEKMNRISSIGASFDTTIDTPILPIVLRGEFLYETGVKTPVVDKLKLSYGDLAGALTMAEADFVKAVIGVDVTIFTNLFASFQYMQVTNLNYVDDTQTYNGKSYATYTANPATISLSNNMRQAEEHQRMYTFFLSRPFFEGDVVRVNNILLLEGDGGMWNRFDVEFTATDNLILSAEYNYYGADENGIFGQFEDQTSIQLGAKYLF